jgi:hypothetical protein
MYYRWPRGTRWVTRNSGGRPQAFVVRNGAVSTWSQSADGTWAGPTPLGNPGGPVVPSVVAITNPNGTVQVFARRANDHHFITVKQTQPGGAWATSWTDLGNPNIQFGGDASQVGLPAVAANADGTLFLFVKDGGGGVCGKRQSANGTWGGAWLDLGGGSDVQPDGLAAIRGSDGRIELVASTTTNVLTWRQSTANGAMVEQGPLPTFSGLEPASPPNITVNHDGTLEVLYREGGNGQMVTTFESAVGGPWYPSPVELGGQGGVGQPALLTAPPGADARIMVFERNDAAGVSMTKQSAPDSPYEAWADLGGTILDYPAATVDSTGAVFVFAIGIDGALYVRKQVSPGANSAFGAWQLIG